MESGFARFAATIGHARARHLLLACCLVTGLMIALATLLLLLTLRAHAIAEAERDLQNLALVLSEETNRSIESVELVQLGLIRGLRNRGINSPEALGQLAGSFEEHQDLLRRIGEVPLIASLSLLDRQGSRLATSRYWQQPQTDNTNRDFIRAQLSPEGPRFFISTPSLSTGSGKWSIYFSRGFNASDGRLLGIVVASIETDYVEQLYSRLLLNGGGAFALYRKDGVLLARYPHVDRAQAKVIGATIDLDRMLAAQDHAVFRRISVFDGKERIIAPHSVAGHPLLITATDTMDAILADWHTQVPLFAGAALLMELIIAGTLVLGVRHLRSYEMLAAARLSELEARSAQSRAEASLILAQEREDAARALERQTQRFDLALSNMLQGLMMFDGGGLLLVVNRRFCQMFGVPADALLPGMRYTEVIDRIVALGNIPADDMRGYRERREALIRQGVRATATWEVSDGRAYTVTHQAMESGWLSTYEDITERRMTEARMAHLARHDMLTDLPNRVLFHELLEAALAHAWRGKALALHCLDLDQFKAVNDTLGHPVGDELLRAVAERLSCQTRPTDTIARLGGDEFAIVQGPIERPAEATALAGRLIELLEAPFEVAGHQIVIGASIGIALSPTDGSDADQLLKSADLALYRAKLDGRGVYRLFQTEMDAQMQGRRMLELDLRRALSDRQLELFYQPFVDVRAGAVTGFEALLRWHHPERGLVAPGLFIPLAEELGLIVPIGEWVLQQACAAVASWPGDMRVAVNLSPVQFKSRHVVSAVAQALHAAGLPPDRLELEITETVMLQDTDATLTTLHELRNLGVNIALDDFGTGYSSLSYLRRFPFDRIKIDQSFVRDMCGKPDSGAIVRAVAGLSNELGMATTAEGVETPEQLDAVTLAGCTEIQGYLFSPAVPASAVADLLGSIAVRLRPGAEVTEPVA